jgi:hypothetical protein
MERAMTKRKRSRVPGTFTGGPLSGHYVPADDEPDDSDDEFVSCERCLDGGGLFLAPGQRYTCEACGVEYEYIMGELYPPDPERDPFEDDPDGLLLLDGG